MITHESHLEAFSPMQMDDFNINIILLCVPYHFTLYNNQKTLVTTETTCANTHKSSTCICGSNAWFILHVQKAPVSFSWETQRSQHTMNTVLYLWNTCVELGNDDRIYNEWAHDVLLVQNAECVSTAITSPHQRHPMPGYRSTYVTQREHYRISHS